MYAHNTSNAYVDYLLAEHQRLHALLRHAGAAIVQSGGPDRDASAADIVRVLRQVRDELSHHFAEEEAGGCLEEAVSRCPRLSREANRLGAEHADLLHQIDELMTLAAGSEPSHTVHIAMENAFKDVCERLYAHEAAENSLLREGFGINVNGDENSRCDEPVPAGLKPR
jgi:hemerythrin HHE cation binding domain-containing protein